MMASSQIDHPNHYTGGIECIDAMIAVYGIEKAIDFCLLNAFKYRWRYKDKNGREDLSKGLWYCNKADELLRQSVSPDKEVNKYLLKNVWSSILCETTNYNSLNERVE